MLAKQNETKIIKSYDFIFKPFNQISIIVAQYAKFDIRKCLLFAYKVIKNCANF